MSPNINEMSSPAARRCTKATSRACSGRFVPSGRNALDAATGRNTRTAARELRVLDVASGKGESAIFLARTLRLQGSGHRLRRSTTCARPPIGRQAPRSAHLVSFQQGDAEKIALPDAQLRRA